MVAYGTEKPKTYRPRLVDERLQRLLSTFGAVEIRGTKWCGKSWAALAFGESVVHLDDPNVKALVEADPSLALQGTRPHVVDEWQEVPSTWDAVRRAVDTAGDRGLFILTGSSTPTKDSVTHSGTGRIARVDMSTMTLWERGLSTGAVPLSGQTFGQLFESLCVHDLRAYAVCLPGAHPGSLRYYGDSDGLEVDVIIELRDGRWAALEVKLGEAKVPDGIRNIERLRKKVAFNPAVRNPKPEFSAVVTATSPFCRHDAEHDVYVFPITALRP